MILPLINDGQITPHWCLPCHHLPKSANHSDVWQDWAVCQAVTRLTAKGDDVGMGGLFR